MSKLDPYSGQRHPNRDMIVHTSTTPVDIPLHKRCVFVSSSSSETVVKLPDVTEAKDLTFFVQVREVPLFGKVIVDYSNGSSEDLQLSITTSGASVVFESDGKTWHKSELDVPE